MPQLEQVEFFISQLFWLGVFFVILFLVLTYFTLPKIRAFLNKRDEFVQSHISKQDELIKKAEQLIENYEQKLNEAKNQASQIIAEAKESALQDSEKLIKATEDKIQQGCPYRAEWLHCPTHRTQAWYQRQYLLTVCHVELER